MPVRTLTFTETLAGVTYTAVTSVPPGARITDILLETFTAWTAATAPLAIGDSDAADALMKSHDMAPQQGIAANQVGGADDGTDWGNGLTGGNGPYSYGGPGKLYPSGDIITAVISPTVPGGPTGASRVTVLYEHPGVHRLASVV